MQGVRPSPTSPGPQQGQEAPALQTKPPCGRCGQAAPTPAGGGRHMHLCCLPPGPPLATCPHLCVRGTIRRACLAAPREQEAGGQHGPSESWASGHLQLAPKSLKAGKGHSSGHTPGTRHSGLSGPAGGDGSSEHAPHAHRARHPGRAGPRGAGLPGGFAGEGHPPRVVSQAWWAVGEGGSLCVGALSGGSVVPIKGGSPARGPWCPQPTCPTWRSSWGAPRWGWELGSDTASPQAVRTRQGG